MMECSLCGDECENVSLCYGSVQLIVVYTRVSFMKKLQELVENVEKLSYVLYIQSVSYGRVSSMDCLAWNILYN